VMLNAGLAFQAYSWPSVPASNAIAAALLSPADIDFRLPASAMADAGLASVQLSVLQTNSAVNWLGNGTSSTAIGSWLRVAVLEPATALLQARDIIVSIPLALDHPVVRRRLIQRLLADGFQAPATGNRHALSYGLTELQGKHELNILDGNSTVATLPVAVSCYAIDSTGQATRDPCELQTLADGFASCRCRGLPLLVGVSLASERSAVKASRQETPIVGDIYTSECATGGWLQRGIAPATCLALNLCFCFAFPCVLLDSGRLSCAQAYAACTCIPHGVHM